MSGRTRRRLLRAVGGGAVAGCPGTEPTVTDEFLARESFVSLDPAGALAVDVDTDLGDAGTYDEGVLEVGSPRAT